MLMPHRDSKYFCSLNSGFLVWDVSALGAKRHSEANWQIRGRILYARRPADCRHS